VDEPGAEVERYQHGVQLPTAPGALYVLDKHVWQLEPLAKVPASQAHVEEPGAEVEPLQHGAQAPLGVE